MLSTVALDTKELHSEDKVRLFNHPRHDQYSPHGDVLEIGPGSAPTQEADVYLDVSRQALDEIDGVTVHGSATDMPFDSGQFDYSICMHVAEHIPMQELPVFFDELARVSDAGYLEMPSIFWELLQACDVGIFPDEKYGPHLSFCFYDSEVLHMIEKGERNLRTILILRALFSKIVSPRVTRQEISLFMIGFEWKESVPYRIHDSLDSVPHDVFISILQSIVDHAGEGYQLPRNVTNPIDLRLAIDGSGNLDCGRQPEKRRSKFSALLNMVVSFVNRSRFKIRMWKLNA
jgi:hypothetical protein